MKLIPLVWLFICNISLANVLETNPTTGIRISNLGTGVGVPLDRNKLEDPRYRYWNSYCGAFRYSPGDALCWPDNPKITYTIPEDAKSLRLSLYMDNGAGYDKGIVDTGKQSVKVNFHTFDKSNTSRKYRVAFNFPIDGFFSTACSRQLREVPLLPSDAGANSVYLIESTASLSTCLILIPIDRTVDTKGRRFSVSLGAIQASYDEDIYRKIPAGDWVLLSNWTDRFTVDTFRGNVSAGDMIASYQLFDGVNIRFKISLERFFTYELLSQPQQTLSFDPAKDKKKAFLFNNRIETNAQQYTMSIHCQHTEGARCALKNGEGVLLPLDIAYRTDFMGGPTYRDFLAEGVPHVFDGDDTRRYLFGLSFILSQAEVQRVEQDHALNSRQFEGGATIIFEALF